MKKLTNEHLIEDFAFLIKTLKAVHPNLEALCCRENLESEIIQVEKELVTCETTIDFYKKVAPFVASLKDGHTSCFPADDYSRLIKDGARLFPFDVSFHDKRAFVVKSYQETEVDLAAEIISINGISIESIIEKLQPYISAETEKVNLAFLQNYFRPLLSLIYRLTDEFQITYKQRGRDEISSTTVAGVPSETITNVHTHKAPTYFSYKMDADIAFVKITNFVNYDEFKTFAKNVFTEIKNANITKLILDVRNNHGGDSRIGDELLKYISRKPFRQFSAIIIKISDEIKQYYRTNEHIRNYYKTTAPHILDEVEQADSDETITYEMEYIAPYEDLHFGGKVNVLTNCRTYSSATNFVAAIKDYELGTIIGESPGGYATHYGDIYIFSLPHSNLEVIVSHKEHIRPSGCKKHEEITPDILSTEQESEFHNYLNRSISDYI